MKQFYVSYINYGRYPVYIELLDYERYEARRNIQPQDNRIHQFKIHVDGTPTKNPIIEILAVIERESMSPERSEQIDQEVINWLIDHGHMLRR